jgi:hypothetical protein
MSLSSFSGVEIRDLDKRYCIVLYSTNEGNVIHEKVNIVERKAFCTVQNGNVVKEISAPIRIYSKPLLIPM